jgi:hypothetical protein
LDSTTHVIHLAPTDQPGSVHQIAERLFPAYTVDDGKVQLAGCTLEDRLFVRLEFRHGRQSGTMYLDAAGVEVAGELVEALGMNEVAELERPPQPPGPELEQAVEAVVRAAVARFPADAPCEVLATAALWCKFAEGKLRFTVGEDSAEMPFSGWSRTLRPPPFVCPHTGVSTFHLAATDDGRIVAAEQIELCAETNRRALPDDLVTCSLTGRRVMPELIEVCPVSGQRVLGSRMVECGTCRQRVSPGTIAHSQCAACRGLQPVKKADPRIARVLHEHPPLDRWSAWRISETPTVYILTAAGWFKRLLVVIDKISLELRHVGTGNRIFTGWNPVEPAQYEYVLRG